MLIKVLFVLSVSIALVECAKLLRKPKVYNAVITTDENLTPSRAYPLFQPVIQPAIPLLSPYYPTSFYDPYNPNPNDVNNGRRELKTEKPIERKSDEALGEETANNEAQGEEVQTQNQEASSNGPEQKPEGDKSPIPLNEYGFPPSLIPLQKYPTYPYNYPFIYDSYGNFQAVQYPVLPPSFYPQNEHQLPPIDQPMFTVARNWNREQPRDQKSLPKENSLPAVSSEAIKNNGNKNSDIPDVELPPIPFTIKNN